MLTPTVQPALDLSVVTVLDYVSGQHGERSYRMTDVHPLQPGKQPGTYLTPDGRKVRSAA
ncbi:hypothetical protein [Deinococcus sp. QL22]|uniref:hypothetical protein n=1 Tax=Deinococcus sp. QL22 TaxID=2939437 RepID=UPI002017818B|nr:hypothetical protein [Deinococcus sp. QL22]UQN06465.1 hypothetical protein M1R55_00680 [Deinococcus sp. QL22]